MTQHVAGPYAAAPPAPPDPAFPSGALVGESRADVAVVGGGITGLSAALHLAQAGARVALLEAGPIGWGASGRNGGQVNPGLKPDPDAVAARFGAAAGERLVQAAWSAPDLVFDLIGRNGIACEAVRGGTLRAAIGAADAAGLSALHDQCARRGMDVALLDDAAIALRSGAVDGPRRYRAALLDRRGGQVNPLAYTQGLAHAAAAAGAALHTHSAVVQLQRQDDGWQLRGAGFSLHAGQVVLATNGYTGGLWPGLARSIVPVYSAIIASAPLPDALRGKILPGREVLYELGEVTTYYRVDAHGRLLIGGRSRSASQTGALSFGFLSRHAERLFPSLRGHAWTDGWNGQLAMTTDHYPHWHEPAPGVFAALGYNGRGIAMATVMGRELARRIGGRPEAELLFPIAPIRPITLHAAWPAAVAGRVALGRALDILRR